MIVAHYKDITEMWYSITEQALNSPDSIIDFHVHGSRIVSSDNLIQCGSPTFEFNLARIGFTKRTFPTFLKKYFTAGAIERWLNTVREQTNGVDNFLPTVNPRHEWGGCFLGYSYRKYPRPRLCLYSRSAIMPTAGTLELTLAHLLAKEIGKPMEFTWLSGSIWWSSLKLIPYLVASHKIEEVMLSNTLLAKSIKSDWVGMSSRQHTYYGRQRILKKSLEIDTAEPIPVSSLVLTS